MFFAYSKGHIGDNVCRRGSFLFFAALIEIMNV